MNLTRIEFSIKTIAKALFFSLFYLNICEAIWNDCRSCFNSGIYDLTRLLVKSMLSLNFVKLNYY